MVDIAEQLVKKWERLNGDDRDRRRFTNMTALTSTPSGCGGFDYRFQFVLPPRDYHPLCRVAGALGSRPS